jgi:hypothetical protein
LAVLGSLPFVPANVGSTNPERAPCFVVPLGFPLPKEVRAFVAGLGLGPVKRTLFRKLGPYQGMAPHTDRWTSGRRFQVPLVSHPDIKMRWPDDGAEEHLAPGWLYEVRFDRTHEVVNPTAFERIHLQIDQIDATI